MDCSRVSLLSVPINVSLLFALTWYIGSSTGNSTREDRSIFCWRLTVMDNSLTVAFTCFLNKSILQVKKKSMKFGEGERAFLFCQNGLQYESICLKASAENETVEKTWSTCFFEIWLQKRILYQYSQIIHRKKLLVEAGSS